MTATAPATIEILGRIEADAEGGRDRLIGRVDAEHFALGELTAEGTFDRKTPIVSFDDVAKVADAVLSGNARAMTWPHSVKVLALGFGVLRVLLAPPLPEPNSPIRPVGPTDGADAPAGAQPPSQKPAGAPSPTPPLPPPDGAAAGAPAGEPRIAPAGAPPGRLL